MHDHKLIKFIVGSYYVGAFNELTHEMEGFGVYTFPDGSIYQGSFRKGKFNGFGHIKLGPPLNMTYDCDWSEGKLVAIHKIVFVDGLHFEFNENPDTGMQTADNWEYCSKNDRRYPKEMIFGLNGVRNHPQETIRPNARLIPPGCYDTEEGIFKAVSGFITHIPRPYPVTRFVDCSSHVDWIKENCRSGGNAFEKSPISKFRVPIHPACPKIIKNNLESMGLPTRSTDDSCMCNIKQECRRYFEDLAKSFRSPESAAETNTPCNTLSGSSDELKSLASSLKRNTVLVARPEEMPNPVFRFHMGEPNPAAESDSDVATSVTNSN